MPSHFFDNLYIININTFQRSQQAFEPIARDF